MNNIFIQSAVKQFDEYKTLGEKTISQLTDEQLFWRPDVESNSIGMIVQHLEGNMLSRWTDFLTTDGEKKERKRDQEFIEHINTRDELVEKWISGWACLFKALHPLTEEDLLKTVFIRNQPHRVMDVIHRQLAHYPYHIGQMVYIGKMLQKHRWQNLSIPKGLSDEFNKSFLQKEY